MDYQQNYLKWKTALAGTPFSSQLEELEKNPALLQDSFYQFLEFGTAGMRGTIALGTNRMNIFTVRRATQGLAEYIKTVHGQQKGVAIAYDSRKYSDVFALETALVLAANGIKVYLFDTLHSVPQLSFAILHLGCVSGVVITASHNPPEYNGYKVYGADGGQLAVEDAAMMTDFINRIDDYFSIQPMDHQAALDTGLLNYIGAEIDEAYYAKVKTLVVNQQVIDSQADNLKIIYTPLYGTGNIPVRRLLSDIGIKNLRVVQEQELPNPDFPGLSAPNPENREAFKLAMELANREGANMIIATDPDCDRMGVAVRTSSGTFEVLTGNQIGCLLMDYILSARQGSFQGDEFVVKSIVSTPMADAIANYWGVEMRNVLTGFKFIAEQIKLAEQSGKGAFVFGFEESYGYLGGTFVRDKDAAMASLLLAEAACAYDAKGMTLADAMDALYQKYDYYKESVLSVTLSGMEGVAKIKKAVDILRATPPEGFAGTACEYLSDFTTLTRTYLPTGEQTPIDLPATNMLIYECDDCRVIFRPSGTEPKLKVYLSVFHENEEIAQAKLEALEAEARALVASITE